MVLCVIENIVYFRRTHQVLVPTLKLIKHRCQTRSEEWGETMDYFSRVEKMENIEAQYFKSLLMKVLKQLVKRAGCILRRYEKKCETNFYSSLTILLA